MEKSMRKTLNRFLLISLVTALFLMPACADESSSDGSDTATGSAKTGQLSLTLSSTVPPGSGGDGTGDLYITLVSDCDQLEQPEAFVFGHIESDVTVPESGAELVLSFENIAPGEHGLVVFLDDVTNASADSPAPGKGDMVGFEGFGPRCVPASIVAGEKSSVVYEFNLVLLFDLP
ncbi:MAG: hypothetical protein IPJ88_04580 [Myxococcales bacterium]|nr:MAG: hypothetical protein IPJ88_04580 [Myxococcales bacterium]